MAAITITCLQILPRAKNRLLDPVFFWTSWSIVFACHVHLTECNPEHVAQSVILTFNLQGLCNKFLKSTVTTCHARVGNVKPHKLNSMVFAPGSVTRPTTWKSWSVYLYLNQQRPSFTEYLEKSNRKCSTVQFHITCSDWSMFVLRYVHWWHVKKV